MENKINIAEILKDYPKGTKLYSPLCGECYFDRLNNSTIICKKQNAQSITFTSEGYYMLPVFNDCECLLFPSKDQRDWSKFQRPFKDGDILVDISGDIYICKIVSTYNYCGSYASINSNGVFISYYTPFIEDSTRYATEEEKQKLFDAIKANGYKWNAETKTLKKLIEPKFKVGDRIKNGKNIATIVRIYEDFYDVRFDSGIRIGSFTIGLQDDWELVPNKFDINTLVPFESRVLVRSGDSLSEWKPAIFGIYRNKYNNFYVVGGTCWQCCIPYEENEHLLGTTNDCDEYYKTW